MTMVMTSAHVDEHDRGFTYCADCAEGVEWCNWRDLHRDAKCGGPADCPICQGEVERAESLGEYC